MKPSKSPTYCVLPWIHQNLSVNGWYKPCCNSHSRYKDDTVKNATLKEAFLGKEATALDVFKLLSIIYTIYSSSIIKFL